MITAIIPAFNEEERIEGLLKETSQYVYDIIVIDDASTDNTAKISKEHGKVIENELNMGYVDSIKKGFRAAEGDIIVTLDADGEHDPSFIPDLVTPIKDGKADLVFGRRKKIPRPSERILSWMVSNKLEIKDTGIGFRALRTDLAKKLDLKGYCTCGLFALEAKSKGAEISEVSTPVRDIEKPKRTAWIHFLQFFVVLKWLFK
ncbi:MAG: glycosyltransferase family 2 protein [Thermoplasmatota archaeon]